MLGDLKGASSANAVFTTKINSRAAAGSYTFPLELNYTHLYQAAKAIVKIIRNPFSPIKNLKNKEFLYTGLRNITMQIKLI